MLATAKTKMIVMPASRMLSAISFGVFCRSAPSTRRDHAIEEGVALRRRDAHHDPVGNDQRAAGDGRAVAAAFADDRRGFAGDRPTSFTEATPSMTSPSDWDEVARLDEHDVARLQLRGRHRPSTSPARRFGSCRRRDAAWRWSSVLHLAQRVRLRLAAPFRHRFGEVGEQHGEPQPDDDLEREAEVLDRCR